MFNDIKRKEIKNRSLSDSIIEDGVFKVNYLNGQYFDKNGLNFFKYGTFGNGIVVIMDSLLSEWPVESRKLQPALDQWYILIWQDNLKSYNYKYVFQDHESGEVHCLTLDVLIRSLRNLYKENLENGRILQGQNPYFRSYVF